ncbi:MFS transporter [Nocardia sp. CA2R105]|uniref:MFS transporter n=1 Tax=Nocardia coffeae TaxID=2873381 RepID=UPI001CA6B27D|nr:MFS transporter [Nocardia coffeae]MBY8858669.1 MFS transporter [Nocardia coffeae]
MTTSNDRATALAADEQKALVSRVSRHVIPLIFLGSVMSYLDRVNLGYAQFGLATDLGVTAAAYGLAAAVFFIAYCVCEIPSNILMERFGARVWMTRIMLSWGIVTVLTGFVQNETQLYIARFLLGLAEAGFFPGMVLYLTRWFRGRDRAVALSWLVIAQPVAFVIGGLTSGVILDHVRWFGLQGWQWVFVLTGVPAVLVGLLILRLLPDRPVKARWLTEREVTWLLRSIDAETVSETRHGLWAQLAALKSPRVLHLGLINFVFALGFYGFNLFVPLVLKQINPTYSATNIGLVAVVPYLFAIGGLLVFSRFGKRPTELRLLTTGLALVSTLGLAGVILLRAQPVPALVALTVAALAMFPFIPMFWAMSTVSLTRKESVVGIAGINTLSALGGFIGPYLVGRASSGATVTPGLLMPLVALVICTVLTAVWRGGKSAKRIEEVSAGVPRAGGAADAPLSTETR